MYENLWLLVFNLSSISFSNLDRADTNMPNPSCFYGFSCLKCRLIFMVANFSLIYAKRFNVRIEKETFYTLSSYVFGKK